MKCFEYFIRLKPIIYYASKFRYLQKTPYICGEFYAILVKWVDLFLVRLNEQSLVVYHI